MTEKADFRTEDAFDRVITLRSKVFHCGTITDDDRAFLLAHADVVDPYGYGHPWLCPECRLPLVTEIEVQEYVHDKCADTREQYEAATW
jgi:hypothetical protein